MKEKQRVVVVYGGPGGEHGVSVKGGENVLKNIDRSVYVVESLLLSKKHKKLSAGQIKFLKGKVVFPVMHGVYGEGGDFQKELERNKINFVGSGSKVSKICIDKQSTQRILKKNSILVPKSFVTKTNVSKKFNFPVILKQVDGGSSVDIRKCFNEKEYKVDLNFLLKKYEKVMVQEFITGREFTCGVIEIGNSKKVLAVTEIILTKTGLFDYEAKYTSGACLEVTPAEVDEKLRDKIQNISKKVFQVLKVKDLGRVDVMMDSWGRIYVLEINTIPGMTDTSLLPQQINDEGISVSEFVDSMIKNNS